MARKNFGFVLGSDVLPKFQNGVESLALLMKEHGLNPDLEAEAFSKFRSDTIEAVQDIYFPKNALNCASLPPGLQEALRRGCRLAAEPVHNQVTDRWRDRFQS